MNIVVREALEADFEQVAELFMEELTFHAGLLPDRFQIADPIMTREWFNEILADTTKMIIVATMNRKIIGLVQLTLCSNPADPIFRSRRYVYIEDLAVSEAFQRQGIGRLLMDQAKDWALKQRVHEIELNVWESNKRGISFYAGLGYQTIQRRMTLHLSG
jgi:ribosomal protein S18 acetylase RimI-like enzyme